MTGTISAATAVSIVAATAEQVKTQAPALAARNSEVMISMQINGALHQFSVDAGTPLLNLLRDHVGLTSTKKGCDQAWRAVAAEDVLRGPALTKETAGKAAEAAFAEAQPREHNDFKAEWQSLHLSGAAHSDRQPYRRPRSLSRTAVGDV